MSQAQTDPGAAPLAGVAAPVAGPSPSAGAPNPAAGEASSVQGNGQAAGQPPWADKVPGEFNRDWSAAFAAGKQYLAMQGNGWDKLAEELGMDGYQLLTAFRRDPDQFKAFVEGRSPQSPSQQPSPEANLGAGYDPSQAFGPQFSPPPPGTRMLVDPTTGEQVPVQMPPDPAQQAMMERLEKLEGSFQTRQEQAEEERRKAEIEARIDNSRQAGNEAVAKYMTDILGIKPKPSEMQFLGRSREIDPHAAWAEGGLRHLADMMYKESLNENDPEYDTKWQMGAPPEMYRQAAEAMRPLLAARDDDVVDQEITRQQGMPDGAPPEGPSGRPQAAFAELSREDQQKQMLAEVQAEGKALGIPED